MWEKARAYVVLFVLLASASFSQSASLKEAEPIPVYYNHYWDDSPFVLPTDLLPLLDSLHLNEANVPTGETIDSMLSRKLGSEASNFSREAKLIGDAHKLAESARIKSEQQKTLILLEIAGAAGGVGTGTGALGIAITAKSAGLYSAYSMNEARLSLNQGFSALEKTASAVNTAFDKVAVEAGKLEFAGAGYENYTGKASGTYNKIQGIIAAYKQNAVQTTNSNLEYKYVQALTLAKSIKNSLEEKNVSPINSEHFLPETLNLLASEDDGVFMQLAELYAEIKSAQSEMFSEYSELENLVDEKRMQLQEEEKTLEHDDTALIDSEIVSAFGSSTFSTSTASPKQGLSELNYLLGGRGVSPSTVQLLEQARELREKKPKYYLARAIEKLEKARALLAQADILSQQSNDDANALLSNAVLLESKRRTETDLLLASFSHANEQASRALEKAVVLRNKAVPPSGTRGKQLLQLYENMKIYSKIEELLSADYPQSATTSAQSTLDELENQTENAENDGLNVDYEKDFIEFANSVLEAGASAATETIREETEKILAELRMRSEAQLDELNARHARLLQLLTQLEEELSSAGMEEDFEKLKQLDESFALNGQLDSQLAAGNYSQLNSSYSQLEGKIDSSAPFLLSKHFSTNAETQLAFEETPKLDEETGASLFISIQNNLNLSTINPFYAVIPIPFDLPPTTTIVSKSPEITQFSSSSGKLLLLFEKAGRSSAYHISFKFSKKFAETISKIDSTLSLNERELRKRTLIKFRSAIPLEKLEASLPLATLPSDHRAVFNERELPVHVSGTQNYSARITLSSIQEGDNILLFEYSFTNPYNTTLEDIRVISNGAEAAIIYDVEVANNGEYLENVPIALLEPANSTINISTIKITGTCTEPENISIKETELGVLTSFECPSLPVNSSCRFPASFTVEDAASYARALASDLSPAVKASGNAELGKRFAQALSLLEKGAYDEAIKLLLALREETTRSLSSNNSERTDFLETELEQLAEQANTANNTMLSQLVEEAQSLFAENDLDNASKKIAEAFALLDASKQDNSQRDSVLAARDSLWIELNDLKNKNAILITLSANTTPPSEFSQAESKFQELSKLLEQGNYPVASALVAELNNSLKNISRELDSAASSFLSGFLSKKDALSSTSSKAEKLFKQFRKALEITVEGISKKNAFTPSFDSDSLEAEFKNTTRHIQKTLQLAANANSPQTLFNNSSDFSTALRELDELGEATALLESEYELFESRANRSVELGFLALNQLDELASKDEQFSKERERLSSLMLQANESLHESRLNDALIVSSFVQDFASKILSSTPKQAATSNSNELAILAVSIIFFLILIAVFIKTRGKGESETKKLLQKLGKEN